MSQCALQWTDVSSARDETLERFTGQGSHPKSFGGRVLATKLDGIWNLPEGDLHYVSFDVDGVEFE